MADQTAIAGLILAGGLGRRIGGDKAFRTLGGTPLLARSIGRLHGQLDRLAISANGDPARFAAFGLPVLADPVPNHPGPLAGILAGLDWAACLAPAIHWMISAAVDQPFLPLDLVARLRQARQADRVVLAASGGRAHPVAALWPVAARHALRTALAGGVRKVAAFADQLHPVIVDWQVTDQDPFFNINDPADLAHAEAEMVALERSNPTG